ncbi:MAG: hypothetical protein RMI45_00140 [Ignisphaera sp.]|nr:hypothetical protein [Ignisphaera sp.]MDW8084634.1 hypothetical protein [Ignisphaera sp.]
MKILESIRKIVTGAYIKRMNRVDEVIKKIEWASQHYKRVIENCVNYLIGFSSIIKPHRCNKCGKVFFATNSDNGCPFCSSLYTINIDAIDFKEHVRGYCSSLYGRNITFMDVFKDVVKNLCLNRICYFLESTSSLEIFTEKGALRIVARDGEIIEVELPWIDISTLTYIDEITAVASKYREKLLINGTRFIIYKTYYDNVDVNYVTLIRERFMDAQFFKYFIDELGLNKYIFSKGVLTKIFDIKHGEYIDPRNVFIDVKTEV